METLEVLNSSCSSSDQESLGEKFPQFNLNSSKQVVK